MNKPLLALLASVMIVFIPIQLASADVNDFAFESFDAVYEISINKEFENRPEMGVTETIVAIFPETDQNRGIVRSISATSYGVLPGLVQIISVTDETGKPRDYEVIQEEGFNNVYIKNKDDSYVYGRQTYIIKYSQSWVIRDYQASSGNDEFYWDINGTGWLQSFERVSATVKLDKELSKSVLLSSASCYQGIPGATDSCETNDLTQERIYFAASNLMPGENLTISIPFAPGVVNTSGPEIEGTFAWTIYQGTGLLILLVLAWAMYFRFVRNSSRADTPIVVPQYKPATAPTLLETGIIASKLSHLRQALIVELAVNNQIEIESVAGDEGTFVLRKTSADKDEEGVMQALGLGQNGAEIRIGTAAVKSDNEEISLALEKLIAAKTRNLGSADYFLKRELRLPLTVWLVGVGFYVVWAILASQLDMMTEAGYLAGPILTFLPFSVVYWLLVSKRRYSQKGKAVVAHLKGLEMYMELAEKDRLEFLQSPKGASLKPSEVSGRQVLKLYEDVLPWAILLGLQKQWGQVLTDLYKQQESPQWFIGTSFIPQSLSSFDRALATSLAVSSTGGSSGSGSSGGGGGGGGGRGI
jgi:uncharacterized membrane protein YgcG